MKYVIGLTQLDISTYELELMFMRLDPYNWYYF